MSTALELVYEYRHLMGKCHAGAGLSMDEVEAVEAIEGFFRAGATPFRSRGVSQPTSEAPETGDGNGLSGSLTATLHGGPHRLCDKVELVSAYLDHFVVQVSFFTEPGEFVDLVIEDDELRLSYRFKSRVHSQYKVPNQPGHQVVLELIGAPLLVRRGPKRPKPDQKSLPPRPSSEPRVVAA